MIIENKMTYGKSVYGKWYADCWHEVYCPNGFIHYKHTVFRSSIREEVFEKAREFFEGKDFERKRYDNI